MTAEFAGMDPKVWWSLATVAEGRGITVRDLLDEQNAPAPVTELQRLAGELRSARRDGVRVPRRQVSYLEQKAWVADQERRLNRESFRRMTEEWE